MKISFVSNFPSVNLAQRNICILPFTDTRTRSVGRLLIRSTDLVITTEAARPRTQCYRGVARVREGSQCNELSPELDLGRQKMKHVALIIQGKDNMLVTLYKDKA